MEHWHAAVTENSYNTDRKTCLTSSEYADPRSAGMEWLIGEIESDQRFHGERSLISGDSDDSDVYNSWGEMLRSLRGYDFISEAWEGSVIVPHPHRHGHGIVMGYRLMSIDGDCEETI